ncbi:MAG: hypothetical protein LBE17_09830 [Treponema sp.]|jgi:hypothetical protein|nr:hypothetical protein [Treponema sp.]
MKRFFLISLTTATVFLPAILSAQTAREPAYNIVITPITFEPDLEEDSVRIYESINNEFGWQGQLNNLYRLIETKGGVGDPPAFANLPLDAQAADPRYVLTVNLFTDGPDRVITLNLYNTPNFDLIGNQEMAYRSVDEGLGMIAFFCWSLSSNLPADDRPVEAEREIIYVTPERDVIYVTPEEDISWKNKWFYVGLQGGLSFRLYRSTAESDDRIFTVAPTFDAGLRLEGQFLHFMVKDSYFSFSAETGADISQEKVIWDDYMPTGDKIIPLNISGQGSSGLNLIFPALLKFNYKPSIFSTSLYGGAYAILPLDGSTYSSLLGIPLGIGVMGGINLGVKLGPGLLYMDLQYGMDLDSKQFHYESTQTVNGKDNYYERDVIYKRQMFNLVVGYKFGFLNRRDRRRAQAEMETFEEPAAEEIAEEPAAAEIVEGQSAVEEIAEEPAAAE